MSWTDRIAAASLKLQAVAALLPAAVAIAKAIEDAIPWQGQGQRKLELLREQLEQLDELKDSAFDFARDIWPRLAALISGLVAVWNALGVFKSGDPAPRADG